MIKENITIDNLLKETEGEESYFKDFLEALLNVRPAEFELHVGKKVTIQERPFVNHLSTLLKRKIESNSEYAHALVTVDQTKCNSVLKDIIKCRNLLESPALDNFGTHSPDLILHKNYSGIDGQYILCEAKIYGNEHFDDFLHDFEKIRIMKDAQLDFNYYIFLLAGADFESLKKAIQEKGEEVKWNKYYLDTVCVCLHNNWRTLDYALLGDIFL